MKIICIGRNYPQHAAELGNEKPESPVVFIKPDTAKLQRRVPFYIPPFSDQINHEVEVLVKINRIGKYIEEKFAHKYYQQIGLGIDFTARDLQQNLKEKGLPYNRIDREYYSDPSGFSKLSQNFQNELPDHSSWTCTLFP